MQRDGNNQLYDMLKNASIPDADIINHINTNKSTIDFQYVHDDGDIQESVLSAAILRGTVGFVKNFLSAGYEFPTNLDKMITQVADVMNTLYNYFDIKGPLRPIGRSMFMQLIKKGMNKQISFEFATYYHEHDIIHILLKYYKVNPNANIITPFTSEPESNAVTPFHLYAIALEPTNADTKSQLFGLNLLLNAGADPTIPFKDGTTVMSLPIFQMESKKKLKEAVEAAIASKPVVVEPMWEGWTQRDAAMLDEIFTEEGAKNYSVCPVCLKHAVRADGCMYMHHDCKGMGGYYNADLYAKYKNVAGEIEWCTFCGRICRGHRHFKLGLMADAAPAFAAPAATNTAVFYMGDCRGPNGGGGIPEKIERFRTLRQYARELQDERGTMTRKAALNYITEAMWNAPIMPYSVRVGRIQAQKRWNFNAANAFPPEDAATAATAAAAAAASATNNAAPIPNIARPATNVGLMPVLVAEGYNAVSMNDAIPVVQFVHRMADGTVNSHDGEGIGLASLKEFIGRMAHAEFGTPAFGKCWNRAGGCTAYLHPDEVARAFELLGEPNVALVAEYRAKFNRKFHEAGLA